MKGKFIVFYGPNNTGKTTQAKLLVANLHQNGYEAEYIKYPVYDLKPSGPIINDYLRHGNPYGLTPREIQIVYALNRRHFEPKLKQMLEKGINVIAECYIGTGLAWGEAAGVDPRFLRHINSHLLPEDLAFCFSGPGFSQAKEAAHCHENNAWLFEKAAQVFSRLADEFGWINIDARGSIKEKERTIFEYVSEYIQNTNSPHSFPSFSYWHKNFSENMAQKQTEKIRITRLSPLAQLPRARNGYIFNLFSHGYYSVNPGENVSIATGISLSLPADYIALVKSDLGHFSFIIDSSQTKEIELSWFNSTHDIYHIAPGQKIGQLMFQRLVKPNI